MACVPARDIGEFLQVIPQDMVSVTAGGAGDAAEMTGDTINRQTYGNPESCLIVVQYEATVGASETLKLTVKLEDDDNSGMTSANSQTLASAVTVETGAVTAENDVYVVKAKLSGLQQYIRAKVTPDLSRANTDTALVSYSIIMGPGRDTALLDAADASDE